ncbi:phosphotransferase [Aggregatilineales bacterium SYSU G02658]
MNDTLQQIRDLQFSDKSEAERLLLSFLKQQLDLDVVSVRLTPKPTSLNSFNGFLILSDGSERFFKTHTETHTVIREYYNANMLANAGYPVIQPVFSSTKPGQQILLYEVVKDPSVFDIAWEVEVGSLPLDTELSTAQSKEDKALFDRYFHTLVWQNAQKHADAPIHQLFWHRLTGGRLALFYSGFIQLPEVGDVPFADISRWQWQINGQVYTQSIEQILAEAATLLDPHQEGPAIIGHGDAHNGNVFLRRNKTGASLVYFDPAFAGYHDPLLDLVKPLFHNVFAMWMYFPREKQATTPIRWAKQANTAYVEYDYELPDIRKMFFQSKVNHVLLPTLHQLKRNGWLRKDWRRYLKLALFCCPLLTMNLSDHHWFSPEIALLGLCMAVEMGAESAGRLSLLDQTLNQLEALIEA